MIEKMNQIFEENYVNAKMTKKAVIVNVAKIFTETVVSVENTLKAEGVKIGETYWNTGLSAYIIPVLDVVE